MLASSDSAMMSWKLLLRRLQRERAMPRCDTCSNEYDKTFEVIDHEGNHYVFDSFECAIHKLAPRCTHCGCRIIGHGVEAEGEFYCCAHCAQETGHALVRDRE
jgi:hypothetical protein